MKKWFKTNKIELMLGIGLSLFFINHFTEQDDELYVWSIPLIVLGLIMLYKRHFRNNSISFNDEFLWGGEIDDDLYEHAKSIVLQEGKASTSFLQRKLRIGYARSAHLMDMLEANGVTESINKQETKIL